MDRKEDEKEGELMKQKKRGTRMAVGKIERA